MSLNKFTIQNSFAISAGAGTGKTYTLSRRYINALLGFDYFREDYKKQDSFFALHVEKSAKVNKIVTITYTEAAALEMKGRIFELVSKIINPDLSEDDEDYKSIQDANEHISQKQKEYVQETLKQSYTDSSNAKISTIHSYCLDIIKSNADIAKIDTKLDIIKDDEKQKVLSKIIFEVLNDEKNKDLVLDISQDISMFFIDNLINKYVSNTKFRNDYDSFDKDSIDTLTYKELIRELYPLPCVDEALEELENDRERLEWFKDFYNNFINFDAKTWKEVDTQRKSPSMGIKKYPITNPIKKSLEGMISHYAFVDIELEDKFFDKITKIKTILHQIKNRYDEELNNLNKIDFDTIITKTRDIIPHVKTGFKYIMVDEFQDTNAVQFEIVKNSCSNDTNLFVVGDSKQSIYSFQGAEIEVFNDAIEDKERFDFIEPMVKNHRSDGVVLDTINKIFEELLKKDSIKKLIKPNYEADAQELFVFKEEREEKGSFRYLITPQEYLSKDEKQDEEIANELDTIAQFISEIKEYKHKEYAHISKLIENKQKAVAIVFDSSTKMLELKHKLRVKGITAKVSASDNFYYTKEVNDIFNVLKAIDILLNKKEPLSPSQKYYVAGALRSNILRCDDNSIKEYLETETISERLAHYIEIFKTKTLSQAVKYIYDDSNIFGVYAHYDDIEQRVANLYKFLMLCKDYEDSNESNLYKFLSLIENAIYFSEAKEDEAFFKSDNTKSIEICSIHSTKGLAYPLVLLANSEKGLYSQITSDALKHNNFTLNGEKKEIVGFKIDSYIPLSHRVLKEIDKLKHLAEKKRLLYVALTRAKHDIVISAELNQKKDGGISLREDSYLHMIIKALHVDKNNLYDCSLDNCIALTDSDHKVIEKEKVNYIEHSLAPLTFKSDKPKSATSNSETSTKDNTAAKTGTVTHKIIELYWKSFASNQDALLDKMMIFEPKQREAVIKNMDSFYNSEIYGLLKNGVKHQFELEFNVENKTGFIDLIYEQNGSWVIVDFKTGKKTEAKNQDYQKQLDFYKDVIEKLGYKALETKIIWLGEDNQT